MAKNKNFVVILGTLYRIVDGNPAAVFDSSPVLSTTRISARREACDQGSFDCCGHLKAELVITDGRCECEPGKCHCAYVNNIEIDEDSDGDKEYEYEDDDPQIGLDLCKELIRAGFTTEDICSIERIAYPNDVGDGVSAWKL